MPAPITQTVCFFFELSFSLATSSLLPSDDDAMMILKLSFVRGTTSTTSKCSFYEVLLWRSYNAENMRCVVVHNVEYYN